MVQHSLLMIGQNAKDSGPKPAKESSCIHQKTPGVVIFNLKDLPRQRPPRATVFTATLKGNRRNWGQLVALSRALGAGENKLRI
jgi:hypothetical protein